MFNKIGKNVNKGQIRYDKEKTWKPKIFVFLVST